MKNFVNALIRDNDDGCQAWEKAMGSMKSALQLFGSANKNNQNAVDLLNSMGSSDSIKKAVHYFKNHVGGIIQNNHDNAQTVWDEISKIATPINGVSLYGKRALPLLPTQQPMTPRERSFLVAAAGLVIMLAAITAGSYRCNILKKKIRPLEANKMLAHDADITDAD